MMQTVLKRTTAMAVETMCVSCVEMHFLQQLTTPALDPFRKGLGPGLEKWEGSAMVS